MFMRVLNGKLAVLKFKKMINFLQNDMRVTKIRFPDTSIGIKPISREGFRDWGYQLAKD